MTTFAIALKTLLLNFEFFISRRLLKKGKGSNNYTKPIIQVSIAAIALGIIIMTLALAIVSGFQKEIRDKVIGFGSHIQINSFESRNSLEGNPISSNQDFYPSITENDGIRHIQVFAIKTGIIKTKEEIQGVVLKGVSDDFDWKFFNDKLISGRNLAISDTAKSNEIIISKTIASKLKMKVGDKLNTYFIQQPPRARKFEVVGIYESGFAQFDELYCLIDIKQIQKLNDWEANEISGFEILINQFEDLYKMDDFIYEHIGYDLNAINIVDANPDIFNWLELQDINVVIIIMLMLVVAAINIISALLILILDRINMIGILKALGAGNWSIRKIFLINAAYLVGLGLFWGNLIGISFCLLQQKFEFIKLQQESYFVSMVPIDMHLSDMIALNLGTLLICMASLILPSIMVTKINPVQAIRFT